MNRHHYTILSIPVSNIRVDEHYAATFPRLPDQQRQELMESIRQCGVLTPLGVAKDQHNGCYVLLDGHHRWEIAKRLGLSHVPCVMAEDPVTQVHMRYAANLHRRQLSGDESNKLLKEYRCKLNEAYAANGESDATVAALQQLANADTAAMRDRDLDPEIGKLAHAAMAKLAQLAPSGAATPAADQSGDAAALSARVADLEQRLKEAEKLCRSYMRQKADLEAALEAYEGQAADDATASAAVKHASKEVRDLRQKLQSTSQTMRQLMEERDRLKDEVQSIKNERDMWLKTEYNVLRNDLYALEEENKQLKGVLHGAERAVGLLQALARFTRELANVLDCTEHSWTDEECQQGLAAYEELAKAWEAVREPLELALHGIPPGRSVFDRAYPDKRYREPRDKFLAQRAAGNGEAQSSQSGKRPPKRTQPDPALEIDDPDALEHEIQALEREWAASSSPEDDADD